MSAPVSDEKTREHVDWLRGIGGRSDMEIAAHIEKLARENAALRAERDARGSWKAKALATVERVEKLRAERDALSVMVDKLLNHCPKDECGECSEIVCPHGDSFHLHHDGCPSCYTLDETPALSPPAQASDAEAEMQRGIARINAGDFEEVDVHTADAPPAKSGEPHDAA